MYNNKRTFLPKLIILRVSSETTQTVEASSIKSRLLEFFDDEKNWGAQEVKTGRSWNKEELRLKSNTDLHKIWYVCTIF